MSHRLSLQAERDLTDIWFYIASESGSIAIAKGVVASLTEKFISLAQFPYLGKARPDLHANCRSLVTGEYVIVYAVEDNDVLILRVVHGRRDFEALFGR